MTQYRTRCRCEVLHEAVRSLAVPDDRSAPQLLSQAPGTASFRMAMS